MDAIAHDRPPATRRGEGGLAAERYQDWVDIRDDDAAAWPHHAPQLSYWDIEVLDVREGERTDRQVRRAGFDR